MNVISQSVTGNQKKVPAIVGEGQSQPLVKKRKSLIDDDSGCCVFRRRVYALLDDPSSSVMAKVISIWIMFLIFLSCGAFIVKTLPVFYTDTSPIWELIEAFSIINFTVEYVVKLLCCPNLFRFLIAPLNVIDIVAIVPFYIELALGSTGGAGFAFIRIMRLARVFRLFKLSRYSTGLQILGKTMAASLYPLGLLSFFLAIAVVIFSCVIYIAEAGEWSDDMGTFVRPDGSKSPFDSIPASFWWCVITMTTVGYGDVYPITITGKIVAAITAICGILVLALPITVIGNNFTTQWATLNKDEPAPEAAEEDLSSIAVSTSAQQTKNVQRKLAEIEEALAKFQETQQKLIAQLRHDLS